MLGLKDISRQIQGPLTYKSLQLERNLHKAASFRSSTHRTGLLPLLSEDYTEESSNRIALCFERYIKSAKNFIKETPGFVSELRTQIIYLHNFNKKVAENSLRYPFTYAFEQLLLNYIFLECKVLYKRENYSQKAEQVVEDRILRLLVTIYDAYLRNRLVPADKIIGESAKAIINLCVQLRQCYDVEHRVIENIVVKLLTKTGQLEDALTLTSKRLPCSMDSYLKDNSAINIYKKITSSDYIKNNYVDNDEVITIDDQEKEENNENVAVKLDQELEQLEKQVKRSKGILTICLDEDNDVELEYRSEETTPINGSRRPVKERRNRYEALANLKPKVLDPDPSDKVKLEIETGSPFSDDDEDTFLHIGNVNSNVHNRDSDTFKIPDDEDSDDDVVIVEPTDTKDCQKVIESSSRIHTIPSNKTLSIEGVCRTADDTVGDAKISSQGKELITRIAIEGASGEDEIPKSGTKTDTSSKSADKCNQPESIVCSQISNTNESLINNRSLEISLTDSENGIIVVDDKPGSVTTDTSTLEDDVILIETIKSSSRIATIPSNKNFIEGACRTADDSSTVVDARISSQEKELIARIAIEGASEEDEIPKSGLKTDTSSKSADKSDKPESIDSSQISNIKKSLTNNRSLEISLADSENGVIVVDDKPGSVTTDSSTLEDDVIMIETIKSSSRIAAIPSNKNFIEDVCTIEDDPSTDVDVSISSQEKELITRIAIEGASEEDEIPKNGTKTDTTLKSADRSNKPESIVGLQISNTNESLTNNRSLEISLTDSENSVIIDDKPGTVTIESSTLEDDVILIDTVENIVLGNDHENSLKNVTSGAVCSVSRQDRVVHRNFQDAFIKDIATAKTVDELDETKQNSESSYSKIVTVSNTLEKDGILDEPVEEKIVSDNDHVDNLESVLSGPESTVSTQDEAFNRNLQDILNEDIATVETVHESDETKQIIESFHPEIQIGSTTLEKDDVLNEPIEKIVSDSEHNNSKKDTSGIGSVLSRQDEAVDRNAEDTLSDIDVRHSPPNVVTPCKQDTLIEAIATPKTVDESETKQNSESSHSGIQSGQTILEKDGILNEPIEEVFLHLDHEDNLKNVTSGAETAVSRNGGTFNRNVQDISTGDIAAAKTVDKLVETKQNSEYSHLQTQTHFVEDFSNSTANEALKTDKITDFVTSCNTEHITDADNQVSVKNCSAVIEEHVLTEEMKENSAGMCNLEAPLQTSDLPVASVSSDTEVLAQDIIDEATNHVLENNFEICNVEIPTNIKSQIDNTNDSSRPDDRINIAISAEHIASDTTKEGREALNEAEASYVDLPLYQDYADDISVTDNEIEENIEGGIEKSDTSSLDTEDTTSDNKSVQEMVEWRNSKSFFCEENQSDTAKDISVGMETGTDSLVQPTDQAIVKLEETIKCGVEICYTKPSIQRVCQKKSMVEMIVEQFSEEEEDVDMYSTKSSEIPGDDAIKSSKNLKLTRVTRSKSIADNLDTSGRQNVESVLATRESVIQRRTISADFSVKNGGVPIKISKENTATKQLRNTRSKSMSVDKIGIREDNNSTLDTESCRNILETGKAECSSKVMTRRSKGVIEKMASGTKRSELDSNSPAQAYSGCNELVTELSDLQQNNDSVLIAQDTVSPRQTRSKSKREKAAIVVAKIVEEFSSEEEDCIFIEKSDVTIEEKNMDQEVTGTNHLTRSSSNDIVSEKSSEEKNDIVIENSDITTLENNTNQEGTKSIQITTRSRSKDIDAGKSSQGEDSIVIENSDARAKNIDQASISAIQMTTRSRYKDIVAEKISDEKDSIVIENRDALKTFKRIIDQETASAVTMTTRSRSKDIFSDKVDIPKLQDNGLSSIRQTSISNCRTTRNRSKSIFLETSCDANQSEPIVSRENMKTQDSIEADRSISENNTETEFTKEVITETSVGTPDHIDTSDSSGEKSDEVNQHMATGDPFKQADQKLTDKDTSTPDIQQSPHLPIDDHVAESGEIENLPDQYEFFGGYISTPTSEYKSVPAKGTQDKSNKILVHSVVVLASPKKSGKHETQPTSGEPQIAEVLNFTTESVKLDDAQNVQEFDSSISTSHINALIDNNLCETNSQLSIAKEALPQNEISSEYQMEMMRKVQLYVKLQRSEIINSGSVECMTELSKTTNNDVELTLQSFDLKINDDDASVESQQKSIFEEGTISDEKSIEDGTNREMLETEKSCTGATEILKDADKPVTEDTSENNFIIGKNQGVHVEETSTVPDTKKDISHEIRTNHETQEDSDDKIANNKADEKKDCTNREVENIVCIEGVSVSLKEEITICQTEETSLEKTVQYSEAEVKDFVEPVYETLGMLEPVVDQTNSGIEKVDQLDVQLESQPVFENIPVFMEVEIITETASKDGDPGSIKDVSDDIHSVEVYDSDCQVPSTVAIDRSETENVVEADHFLSVDDLNVQKEEIIALQSDDFEKSKPVTTVAPEANMNMIMLADVASQVLQQEQQPGQNELQKEKQPGKKRGRNKKVIPKEKTPPKRRRSKVLLNEEDVQSKQVTDSAAHKLAELNFKPDDFLPRNTTSIPLANNVYVHKIDEVNVTSEESNDSETNNLQIDEGLDIKHSPTVRKEERTSSVDTAKKVTQEKDPLSIYDEDTLEEDLRPETVFLSIPEAAGSVDEDLLDSLSLENSLADVQDPLASKIVDTGIIECSADVEVRVSEMKDSEVDKQILLSSQPDEKLQSHTSAVDDATFPPEYQKKQGIKEHLSSAQKLGSVSSEHAKKDVSGELKKSPIKNMAQRKRLNPYVSIERLADESQYTEDINLDKSKSQSIDIGAVNRLSAGMDQSSLKQFNRKYTDMVNKKIENPEKAEIGPDADMDEVPLLKRLQLEEDTTKVQNEISEENILPQTPVQEPVNPVQIAPKKKIMNQYNKDTNLIETLNQKTTEESPNNKYYTTPKLRRKSQSTVNLDKAAPEKLSIEQIPLDSDVSIKPIEILPYGKSTISPTTEKLKKKLECDGLHLDFLETPKVSRSMKNSPSSIEKNIGINVYEFDAEAEDSEEGSKTEYRRNRLRKSRLHNISKERYNTTDAEDSQDETLDVIKDNLKEEFSRTEKHSTGNVDSNKKKRQKPRSKSMADDKLDDVNVVTTYQAFRVGKGMSIEGEKGNRNERVMRNRAQSIMVEKQTHIEMKDNCIENKIESRNSEPGPEKGFIGNNAKVSPEEIDRIIKKYKSIELGAKNTINIEVSSNQDKSITHDISVRKMAHLTEKLHKSRKSKTKSIFSERTENEYLKITKTEETVSTPRKRGRPPKSKTILDAVVKTNENMNDITSEKCLNEQRDKRSKSEGKSQQSESKLVGETVSSSVDVPERATRSKSKEIHVEKIHKSKIESSHSDLLRATRSKSKETSKQSDSSDEICEKDVDGIPSMADENSNDVNKEGIARATRHKNLFEGKSPDREFNVQNVSNVHANKTSTTKAVAFKTDDLHGSTRRSRSKSVGLDKSDQENLKTTVEDTEKPAAEETVTENVNRSRRCRSRSVALDVTEKIVHNQEEKDVLPQVEPATKVEVETDTRVTKPSKRSRSKSIYVEKSNEQDEKDALYLQKPSTKFSTESETKKLSKMNKTEEQNEKDSVKQKEKHVSSKMSTEKVKDKTGAKSCNEKIVHNREEKDVLSQVQPAAKVEAETDTRETKLSKRSRSKSIYVEKSNKQNEKDASYLQKPSTKLSTESETKKLSRMNKTEEQNEKESVKQEESDSSTKVSTEKVNDKTGKEESKSKSISAKSEQNKNDQQKENESESRTSKSDGRNENLDGKRNERKTCELSQQKEKDSSARLSTVKYDNRKVKGSKMEKQDESRTQSTEKCDDQNKYKINRKSQRNEKEIPTDLPSENDRDRAELKQSKIINQSRSKCKSVERTDNLKRIEKESKIDEIDQQKARKSSVKLSPENNTQKEKVEESEVNKQLHSKNKSVEKSHRWESNQQHEQKVKVDPAKLSAEKPVQKKHDSEKGSKLEESHKYSAESEYAEEKTIEKKCENNKELRSRTKSAERIDLDCEDKRNERKEKVNPVKVSVEKAKDKTEPLGSEIKKRSRSRSNSLEKRAGQESDGGKDKLDKQKLYGINICNEKQKNNDKEKIHMKQHTDISEEKINIVESRLRRSRSKSIVVYSDHDQSRIEPEPKRNKTDDPLRQDVEISQKEDRKRAHRSNSLSKDKNCMETNYKIPEMVSDTVESRLRGLIQKSAEGSNATNKFESDNEKNKVFVEGNQRTVSEKPQEKYADTIKKATSEDLQHSADQKSDMKSKNIFFEHKPSSAESEHIIDTKVKCTRESLEETGLKPDKVISHNALTFKHKKNDSKEHKLSNKSSLRINNDGRKKKRSAEKVTQKDDSEDIKKDSRQANKKQKIKPAETKLSPILERLSIKDKLEKFKFTATKKPKHEGEFEFALQQGFSIEPIQGVAPKELSDVDSMHIETYQKNGISVTKLDPSVFPDTSEMKKTVSHSKEEDKHENKGIFENRSKNSAFELETEGESDKHKLYDLASKNIEYNPVCEIAVNVQLTKAELDSAVVDSRKSKIEADKSFNNEFIDGSFISLPVSMNSTTKSESSATAPDSENGDESRRESIMTHQIIGEQKQIIESEGVATLQNLENIEAIDLSMKSNINKSSNLGMPLEDVKRYETKENAFLNQEQKQNACQEEKEPVTSEKVIEDIEKVLQEIENRRKAKEKEMDDNGSSRKRQNFDELLVEVDTGTKVSQASPKSVSPGRKERKTVETIVSGLKENVKKSNDPVLKSIDISAMKGTISRKLKHTKDKHCTQNKHREKSISVEEKNDAAQHKIPESSISDASNTQQYNSGRLKGKYTTIESDNSLVTEQIGGPGKQVEITQQEKTAEVLNEEFKVLEEISVPKPASGIGTFEHSNEVATPMNVEESEHQITDGGVERIVSEVTENRSDTFKAETHGQMVDIEVEEPKKPVELTQQETAAEVPNEEFKVLEICVPKLASDIVSFEHSNEVVTPMNVEESEHQITDGGVERIVSEVTENRSDTFKAETHGQMVDIEVEEPKKPVELTQQETAAEVPNEEFNVLEICVPKPASDIVSFEQSNEIATPMNVEESEHQITNEGVEQIVSGVTENLSDTFKAETHGQMVDIEVEEPKKPVELTQKETAAEVPNEEFKVLEIYVPKPASDIVSFEQLNEIATPMNVEESEHQITNEGVEKIVSGVTENLSDTFKAETHGQMVDIEVEEPKRRVEITQQETAPGIPNEEFKVLEICVPKPASDTVSFEQSNEIGTPMNVEESAHQITNEGVEKIVSGVTENRSNTFKAETDGQIGDLEVEEPKKQIEKTQQGTAAEVPNEEFKVLEISDPEPASDIFSLEQSNEIATPMNVKESEHQITNKGIGNVSAVTENRSDTFEAETDEHMVDIKVPNEEFKVLDISVPKAASDIVQKSENKITNERVERIVSGVTDSCSDTFKAETLGQTVDIEVEEPRKRVKITQQEKVPDVPPEEFKVLGKTSVPKTASGIASLQQSNEIATPMNVEEFEHQITDEGVENIVSEVTDKGSEIFKAETDAQKIDIGVFEEATLEKAKVIKETNEIVEASIQKESPVSLKLEEAAYRDIEKTSASKECTNQMDIPHVAGEVVKQTITEIPKDQSNNLQNDTSHAEELVELERVDQVRNDNRPKLDLPNESVGTINEVVESSQVEDLSPAFDISFGGGKPPLVTDRPSVDAKPDGDKSILERVAYISERPQFIADKPATDEKSGDVQLVAETIDKVVESSEVRHFVPVSNVELEKTSSEITVEQNEKSSLIADRPTNVKPDDERIEVEESSEVKCTAEFDVLIEKTASMVSVNQYAYEEALLESDRYATDIKSAEAKSIPKTMENINSGHSGHEVTTSYQKLNNEDQVAPIVPLPVAETKPDVVKLDPESVKSIHERHLIENAEKFDEPSMHKDKKIENTNRNIDDGIALEMETVVDLSPPCAEVTLEAMQCVDVETEFRITVNIIPDDTTNTSFMTTKYEPKSCDVLSENPKTPISNFNVQTDDECVEILSQNSTSCDTFVSVESCGNSEVPSEVTLAEEVKADRQMVSEIIRSVKEFSNSENVHSAAPLTVPGMSYIQSDVPTDKAHKLLSGAFGNIHSRVSEITVKPSSVILQSPKCPEKSEQVENTAKETSKTVAKDMSDVPMKPTVYEHPVPYSTCSSAPTDGSVHNVNEYSEAIPSVSNSGEQKPNDKLDSESILTETTLKSGKVKNEPPSFQGIPTTLASIISDHLLPPTNNLSQIQTLSSDPETTEVQTEAVQLPAVKENEGAEVYFSSSTISERLIERNKAMVTLTTEDLQSELLKTIKSSVQQTEVVDSSMVDVNCILNNPDDLDIGKTVEVLDQSDSSSSQTYLETNKFISEKSTGATIFPDEAIGTFIDVTSMEDLELIRQLTHTIEYKCEGYVEGTNDHTYYMGDPDPLFSGKLEEKSILPSNPSSFSKQSDDFPLNDRQMMELSEYVSEDLNQNNTEQLSVANEYAVKHLLLLGGQPSSDTIPFNGSDYGECMNLMDVSTESGVTNKSSDFSWMQYMNEENPNPCQLPENVEANPKVVVVPNECLTPTFNISTTDIMDSFSEQSTENSSSSLPLEAELPSSSPPSVEDCRKDDTSTTPPPKKNAVKPKTTASLNSVKSKTTASQKPEEISMLPVRRHSRTPVIPPKKKPPPEQLLKETKEVKNDLKRQAEDSPDCKFVQIDTNGKDVPILDIKKASGTKVNIKLPNLINQPEANASRGKVKDNAPSDDPAIKSIFKSAKCNVSTVLDDTDNTLPNNSDSVVHQTMFDPTKLKKTPRKEDVKETKEVKNELKRPAEDNLQSPPSKVAKILANSEPEAKASKGKNKDDAPSDHPTVKSILKPAKHIGKSSPNSTVLEEIDNALPNNSDSVVHQTMFDAIKLRKRSCTMNLPSSTDTKKYYPYDTPNVRSTRQKTKRKSVASPALDKSSTQDMAAEHPKPKSSASKKTEVEPPNITDNLLKLKPIPRTKLKPIPKTVENYPAKYSQNFLIDSLLKKEAELKKRSTKEGSSERSGSKRDISCERSSTEDSTDSSSESSDGEERGKRPRVKSDNNDIFDKLVQQDNVNQNISFIITPDNKLKTKVRSSSKESLSNSRTRERDNDSQRTTETQYRRSRPVDTRPRESHRVMDLPREYPVKGYRYDTKDFPKEYPTRTSVPNNKRSKSYNKWPSSAPSHHSQSSYSSSSSSHYPSSRSRRYSHSRRPPPGSSGSDYKTADTERSSKNYGEDTLKKLVEQLKKYDMGKRDKQGTSTNNGSEWHTNFDRFFDTFSIPEYVPVKTPRRDSE